MKQKIPLILIIIFGIWLYNNPNTKALMKGLRGSFVDAPIKKAKSDFRKQAEEKARKQAEKRMKEIDDAIDKAM